MSSNEAWLSWLVDGQRSSSVLVSQFSMIKAFSYIDQRLSARLFDSRGVLDRFAKRYLARHAIIGAVDATPELYTSLARRYGNDDLELFAICLAIRNDYEYLCWDNDELSGAALLAPELVSKLFSIAVDEIHSS
jgi:hypothetical protein